MTKNFADSEVYKAFEHKQKAKILLYIENMYTKESKLNKIADPEERKRSAMTVAKLDPEDGEIKMIMEMKNLQVNELIFHFLSYYQYSTRFMKLMADEQLLINMFKQLMKPVADAEAGNEESMNQILISRSKLSLTATDLMSSVERQKSDIYGTDDAKQNADMHIKKVLSIESRIKNKIVKE